jgi:transcriptional regulator GlxA family with amidase domain
LTVHAESKAFDITVCAAEPKTMTNAGIPLGGQISFAEAHKRLKEFDVLIVPGGNILKIIKEEEEPLDLISAYAELQTSDPTRERTLLAVDTAALLLAKQGILQGLAATTHPDYYIKMEHICQEAASNDTQERTDVMEERYVVNHGRFEIGEDDEENPYVFRKNRRGSNARKGSMLRKMSNARRESIVKRANMKLGGLRVITTGGPASGLDATLYLVSALVSHESAQEASRLMQYDWVKGVVVDAIDV